MSDGGSLRPEPGQVVPAAYEGTWKFDAPALDSSVPQSRHAVRDLLVRRRVPIGDDLLQGVLLIVSELVTNAVRHAGVLSPEIGVELSVGAGWVRVAVRDQHPYRPKALQADDEETGGRGLLLVKAITSEAGGACDVQHTVDGGKVIWASLPLAGVTTPRMAPSAPGWPAWPRRAPS
ncbi:ATP-binding protein [Streptomyces sp. CMB-StM0423]|uniref:ATP-binding protein n=1 Tax=Streptomyces sp. CMB-StM0423 TaxID=2059884 RepID=UPI000C7063B1|nr:ATP-binding protein [Streptomyces sp. CMB-StM0423]AUH39206.1 ATP-binding protein [Streptomyces sp. CMB-StM0423]